MKSSNLLSKASEPELKMLLELIKILLGLKKLILKTKNLNQSEGSKILTYTKPITKTLLTLQIRQICKNFRIAF